MPCSVGPTAGLPLNLGFSQFPDSVVRLGVGRPRQACSEAQAAGMGQPTASPTLPQTLRARRPLHARGDAAGHFPHGSDSLSP